jgi:hypothetical protein
MISPVITLLVVVVFSFTRGVLFFIFVLLILILILVLIYIVLIVIIPVNVPTLKSVNVIAVRMGPRMRIWIRGLVG